MARKFRFYIASMGNGDVYGTDSQEVADAHRDSEDDFVIDTQEGLWLSNDDDTIEIEEKLPYISKPE